MNKKGTLIDVKNALSIVLRESESFGLEDIDFKESLGRVLRENITADREMPPFNRVSMDGIAIKTSAFESGRRDFKIENIKDLSLEEKNLRKKNLDLFSQNGFPNKKDEDWKFTDLNSILEKNFNNIVNKDLLLEDKKLKRVISIKKSNSDSLVVWNPGKEKANAMSDMGKKDEWRRMVCIETANTLENSVVIYPKLSHSISTEYSVQEY